MGWRDAPIGNPPPQQPQAQPQGKPWQSAPSVDDVLGTMSHDEMVQYYRTSKKGDPLADAIEQRLSQPQQGETPDQTDRRLYGHMDKQFSMDGSTMAGAADAAALGGADEIAGAIGGAKSWMQGKGFQPGYDESLDKAREALRVAHEDHPYAYGGGQVLGGVAQGAVMGPGSGAASLGGRMAAGAGAGATQGGAYSFLSGEDGTVNRLKGVPVGAAFGGAVGGAIPVASAALGWLRGRHVDRGLEEKARGKIADMLESTTMSTDDAAKIAQKQGDLGMIADVNEGMQVATGGTSAAGGAGVISPRLAHRREGAPDRVNKALTDTFGPYTGPQKVKDLISEARAPAGPAYELAKQHIVIPDRAAQKLDELSKTYGPSSELGKLLKGYREQLIRADGSIEDQGHIIHGIREQLDDDLTSLYNSGRGKMAGRLKELRAEIDTVLKDQIPGFAEADKLWSDTAKIDRAYTYGKDEILGKTHPGEVQATVGKMPDPELAAARAGVRDEIQMQMAQPSSNAGARAERILGRNMNQEKVGNFTTPERADKLAQTLDNEATFTDTSNLAEATRQSRTAPVSGAAQKFWGVAGGADPSMVADAAAGAGVGFAIGGPHGAMLGGAAAFAGRLRQMIANALSSKNSDLINTTADLLTRQGKARDALIDDIIKRAQVKTTKAAAGKQLDAIVRTLTQGLPGVASNQYEQMRKSGGGW